jgi:hypothetical protein
VDDDFLNSWYSVFVVPFWGGKSHVIYPTNKFPYFAWFDLEP